MTAKKQMTINKDDDPLKKLVCESHAVKVPRSRCRGAKRFRVEDLLPGWFGLLFVKIFLAGTTKL
jgi:hypothetical protein